MLSATSLYRVSKPGHGAGSGDYLDAVWPESIDLRALGRSHLWKGLWLAVTTEENIVFRLGLLPAGSQMRMTLRCGETKR